MGDLVKGLSEINLDGSNNSSELGVTNNEQHSDDNSGSELHNDDSNTELNTEGEEEEEEGKEGKEGESEGEGNSEGDGEGEINSITDLAKAIEVEPSMLYDLEIPMRDGMEPVTLSELKDAYHEMKSGGDPLAKDRAQLEQDRLAFQNELVQQQGQQKFVDETMMKADQEVNSILASYDQIDWQRFETENPAEAVLQKQKFQEAYNSAVGRKEAASNEITARQQQFQQNYLIGQQHKTLDLIPEWKDRTVFNDDRIALRTFISQYGFSEQEISNIGEARLVKFAYDFMKLKNSVDKASPKKIENARKISRLKTGPLKVAKKGQKVDQLMAAGIKTTDSRKKASVITELLNSI